MIHETYQDLKIRNTRAKELATVYGKENVRRSNIKGQQLHPEYVKDYLGPEKYDTGFGNTVYKTYFSVLYIVEVSV